MPDQSICAQLRNQLVATRAERYSRHIQPDNGLNPCGGPIVEPCAGDAMSDNLNPIGGAYYSLSTFLCVPCALCQDGGFALGAQAGEPAIAGIVARAGFTRFRRAAGTPFNLVFEARP
jgi:hypothetical protein